jgi:hypothetical protein
LARRRTLTLGIPKLGGSGAGTTNLLLGVAAAGIAGYIGYTYFFKNEVEPTATAIAAAGEEMMNLRASTDLVSLEEQLVSSVLEYAQNRDTALGNRDRIRQAAMTYRLKLEELIKEKLGGRLTDIQMEQQLMEIIKDLAASLNIPLRTGSRPPNPAAWEYWKQNLECKGGERFSNCLNKCVPSYQPEPLSCGPFGPRPAYPTPGVCPPFQRWSSCFRRCVPAGQSEPFYCPPSGYPRPGYPRPPYIPPRPGYPYPYPYPRPPYIPSRPIPRPPLFPRPIFGCRRDRRKCSRKYNGSCNRECRKRWGNDCRGCQCACHGGIGGGGPRPGFPGPRPIPGYPGAFSGGARAYNVSNIYGKIHRKLGRKLCKARCKMIRGRGRGDCEKACKRHRMPFPRPPFPPGGPFPVPPVPMPMPIPPFPGPSFPPVPPPYEIPVPPPYYPPPPPPGCPPGHTGIWPQCVPIPQPCPPGYTGPGFPNCLPIPQPPVILPQAPSPYVSPTPNTYPNYMTLEQAVRQSTTPIGVYAGRARMYRAMAAYNAYNHGRGQARFSLS